MVWIADFGLAKGEDEGLTQSGDILGTLRYMPPERFRGEGDARTDIYALGLTLYELLTLRPAFDSPDRLKLIEQIKTQEPRKPRAVDARIPRDLETIVLKAIEKDLKARYQSAEAMGEDLRRFLADEPIRARPVTPHERLWRWCRRNPLVASLTVGIALSLFAGSIVSWVFAVRARHDAQAARTQEGLARTAQRLSDRRWYAAEMNLAFQDWKEGHLDLVQERLSRHGAASAGQKDPRGFEWYYLDHLRNLDLATLRGHRGAVKCLAFSADGTKIASGASSDGQPNEVILWDVAGEREIRRFEAPGGPLQRLMFSPDGKRLALAAGEPGRPGEIQIWDVTRVHLDRTLPAGPSTVFCRAFHPDSQTLASAADSGAIKIWNTSTGLIDRVLEGHESEVLALAFVAAGKTLASVSLDQTVRLWETTTGRQTSMTRISLGSLRAAALSPDGKALAGCGDDARVRIWNLRTGQETASFTGAIRPDRSTGLQPRWPPPGRLGRRPGGTGLADGGSRPPLFSAVTPRRSSIWRSVPTAGASPPRAATARSRSGMPSSQRRLEYSPTTGRSRKLSRSAPTAAKSPRPTSKGPSEPGTGRRVEKGRS